MFAVCAPVTASARAPKPSASPGQNTTDRLEASVRQLKGLTAPKELWKAIGELAGSSEGLTEFTDDIGKGKLVAPKHFKRAVLTRVNLDRDRRKESVTQIVFHQQTGRPDSPKLYILIVNDDDKAGAPVLKKMFYRHTHCAHASDPSLTLRFKRLRRRTKQLRVMHSVIVDCGATVGGHERVDRLVFKRGKFVLKRGRAIKRWEMNRKTLDE